MFPLPYIKIGLVVLALSGAFYTGYRFEANRFDAYKVAQQAATQQKERQSQAAADRIEKEKNAQIQAINNQLVDAISQLRQRPNRAQAANTGPCGTGATLFADDAELLVREAARADQIRTGLDACYKQYDALNK